ncbi:hypothetical protein HPB49_016628 [Dermacentor silvarum]|uniref:Uncharacterized protein n=1 Tax=Dermacentor silvarum TaxID=543639 RepID=A0ACB8DJZ8_DERSI|nr:hypothetical protein HPB49_016628 [Dermacentor silvarum]
MTERTKSAIWKHFVKNSAQEATCKSCDMKLRTPSSTTTPLANHLKNKHLSLHSVFLRDSGKQGRPEGAQPLIKSALKSGKDLSQRERTAITTRIARMLALDLQPYICVENRGFKELMNHMEPLYKIPSRTTFSRTIIPALYRDTVTAVKERMHADFQEGIESISFTSDMWTSRSNQSYISLTCHCLTSNFEMRSFALDNRSVTESHTACNIMEHLQAMMDNWELPLQEVSVYVVTDNARNFRAALRGISCVSMQCMGHTLQLAIKDAKEETAGVPAILKKCRAIVGHYKHSAQAAARLPDCQRRMELSVLELIQDVETRWNSEHDMLSRLVQLKEAVCLELATSETTVPNLTPQEWKAVAGLIKALEPIASATKDLSGQKYATLSSVVPFLYGTQMVLKDCIAADDDTSEFARNLLKSMRTRFPGQDEQKEYVLATACDPRFKNLFCAQTFEETRLVELARTELQSSPGEASIDYTEASTSTAHKERVSSIWDSIEKLAASSKRRHSFKTANIEEFQRYLREPTCIHKINAEQLNTVLQSIINELKKVGLRIIAVIKDNSSMNHRRMSLTVRSSKVCSSYPHPSDAMLLTLFTC